MKHNVHKDEEKEVPGGADLFRNWPIYGFQEVEPQGKFMVGNSTPVMVHRDE